MDQNRKGKPVCELEPQYIKVGLKIVDDDGETGEIVYVSQKRRQYVADIAEDLQAITFGDSYYYIDKQDN